MTYNDMLNLVLALPFDTMKKFTVMANNPY